MKLKSSIAALLVFVVILNQHYWLLNERNRRNEGASDNIRIELDGDFSWAEESEIYKEDDPGVRTDGFVNSESVEIADAYDAISRAKNECNVKYNLIYVSYDGDAEMWKINFGMFLQLGGDVTVYMDKCGITQRIVYGE